MDGRGDAVVDLAVDLREHVAVDHGGVLKKGFEVFFWGENSSERRKLLFLSLSRARSRSALSPSSLPHLQVADGRGVDDVADDEALHGLVLGDEDTRRLAADALDLLGRVVGWGGRGERGR